MHAVAPAPGTPAARLERLTNLAMPEPEAELHWRAIAVHRSELERDLKRHVGLAVAALDYFLHREPRLSDPVIIEGAMLAALRRSAVRDSLTELFNREYFDLTLAREIRRRGRHRDGFSLLLLDLDNLKSLNDRLGHRAGDAALQVLGAVIRGGVRSVDVACRYGGDEFAVLLPDTGPAGTALVGERLRSRMAARIDRLAPAGEPVPLTVSAGIASFPRDASTAAELVGVADRALYLVKRAGGNQVARYSEQRGGAT
jgi:diguanylate cyclase (GGDEF)-like protein